MQIISCEVAESVSLAEHDRKTNKLELYDLCELVEVNKIEGGADTGRCGDCGKCDDCGRCTC